MAVRRTLRCLVASSLPVLLAGVAPHALAHAAHHHNRLAVRQPATGAAAVPVQSVPTPVRAPAPVMAPTGSHEDYLVRAERLNRMEVRSGGQLGALGHVRGLDAAFNVRSYTAALILNQQSQTLGQVLENDPSVRTTFGYGNFSEEFIIRGFSVYGDDVGINGLYGITPRQLVSPQLYDQVQVLNGASAFLNGAAPGGTAIGGNINLVFKHAEASPITRLTGDYTSSGMGGGALDVGRRFGSHHAFGARINVAGLSGQDSIDHERRHSAVVGGDFDWHDDRTRIALDIDYQNQGVNWGRGAIFLRNVTAVPKAPDAASNFGQPWTFTELNYIFGMLNVEHDLNRHITLYGAFGGLGGRESGNYSSLTVTNAATGAGTNGNLYVPYRQDNKSGRLGARINVTTGPLDHKINLGGSGLWEQSNTAYALNFTPTPSNLYRPVYSAAPVQGFVGGNLQNPTRATTTDLYSAFFSDTVSAFHDRVNLTAGFRYQNIASNSYAYAGTGTRSAHYNQGAVTPVVGFVVHPTRQTALYFNRIEGLSQVPSPSGSVVNRGAVFPPYRSVQYEVGGKYDIGRFAASLALFQISQPNGYNVPYGNTGLTIFAIDGEQRNRGIELNLNGTVLTGLRFNGGATVTDANLRHTQGGTFNGKTAIGVPDYTINGNVEYDLPFVSGMTVTGRVVNTGKQWVNNANTLRIPTWTRFDLGARYTFLAVGKPLTLRFGVDNVANKSYWASSFSGYLAEGLPRTYKASFSMDF